jgi:3-methyl-2-oxobutanoate hydroxymethyltransferase
MPDRVTAPSLRARKQEGKKIVCVTAYDAYFAGLADRAGVDVILVGDSVGNTMLGYENTLPVTLEEMLHHTRAASRGVQRALLVADLPFGSYQVSREQALAASIQLLKAGAHAVKFEGGDADLVRAHVQAGIPVIGHLGMTPQSVNAFGGFRVQGRQAADAEELLAQAKALDQAGASAYVLELIPSSLAKQISSQTSSPSIGIGAGAGCDGQIQVLHDVLGFADRTYKHAKAYMDGQDRAIAALQAYAAEVRESVFPGPENEF